MSDSKITDKQAQKEVSNVTKVAASGRMSMDPSDFFKLTRVKETLSYLQESNFFKTVSNRSSVR